jgi:hypothetical protein
VVTLTLALAAATAAAVAILVLRLRGAVLGLSGTLWDAANRLRPVSEDIGDELAVLQLEAEHVQTSVQRLGEARSRRHHRDAPIVTPPV